MHAREAVFMNGEQILIVDDDVLSLKLMTVALTAIGYDARGAGDPDEAMAVLREFSPRLVVMDIQLPRMDGIEFTRLLKADPRTRDAIVVAVTAFATRGEEERAVAAGCDGYIMKPLDLRLFRRLISLYLTDRPEGAGGPTSN
jgi:CheY-like chemotaxis protein